MRIRRLLKPGGFICFSGEPIISGQSPDQELLPYPWGLRLDGEAIRSIAEFGWMELGYSEAYFVELLARCGYSVESTRCPGFWRADAYVARPFDRRYPIERNTLISLYNGRSGWHSSEGTHRWTDGDAWFPLPDLGFRKVQMVIANMGPRSTVVHLSCADKSIRHLISSGQELTLTIDIPPRGHYVRISSDKFQPSSAISGSADTRILGVAVKSIEFSHS
jgi:hypothetical protein